MIHELNASNFILQNIDLQSPELKNTSYDIIVLLVKANWCGFCTAYLPVFRQNSFKGDNVGYMVVESTEHDNDILIEQWKHLVNPVFTINSYPSIVIYNRNGSPLGPVERTQLQESIQRVRDTGNL